MSDKSRTPRSSRQRVVLSGTAVNEETGAEFHVLIRNISTGGAQIRVKDFSPEADTFFMLMEEDRRKVRAIWQDGDELGIEFLNPGKAVDKAPDPEDWSRRERRRRVVLRADLSRDGEKSEVSVQIKDLTLLGARLRLRGLSPMGDEFNLQVRGKQYRARVVWRDGVDFGLAFAVEDGE